MAFKFLSGLLLMCGLYAPCLFGAGVVTNCTEAALRAALTGGGLVTFDCDGTIALAKALGFTNNTFIDGSGHSIILSGGGQTQVIRNGFWNTTFTNHRLTLKHLTIADGYAPYANGGGLENYAFATIIDCTFTNNAVDMAPAFGSAISSSGGLTIVGSTFIHNRSVDSGATVGVGFAAAEYGARNLYLTNCTFVENFNGTNRFSTTISTFNLSEAAFIVNCTLWGNTNGGISSQWILPWPISEIVTVANTIIGDTKDREVFEGSMIIDGGHNLISDNSAAMTNITSLKNTDPMLGPLTNNGGPTLTMLPLPGSLAIDGGDDAAAPPTDQRGLNRLHGPSDIGAVEYTPGHAISGQVQGFRVPPDIPVTTGTNEFITTADGRYLLVGLSAAEHEVQPSLPGWVFIPNTQNVALGPDVVNVNFTAYQSNYVTPEALAGHVTFAGPTGATYEVQSALVLTNWIPYSTQTVQPNGIFEVIDPTATTNPARFFRARKL